MSYSIITQDGFERKSPLSTGGCPIVIFFWKKRKKTHSFSFNGSIGSLCFQLLFFHVWFGRWVPRGVGLLEEEGGEMRGEGRMSRETFIPFLLILYLCVYVCVHM